jgi:hypothetical protein
MSEDQQAWDSFAAAWLSNGVATPRVHGDTDQSYATRLAQNAAAVADLMVRHRKMRQFGVPENVHVPGQNGSPGGLSVATQRALQEVMGDLGTPPGAAGPLPPMLSPPSVSPTNSSTSGACQRAFGGAVRGDGSKNSDGQSNDCYGSYDEQGVCKVCRLPAVTPAELAQQQQRSVRLPPGAA